MNTIFLPIDLLNREVCMTNHVLLIIADVALVVIAACKVLRG